MKNTEIFSNISSIVECDSQRLGLIFSIVLEIINNYQEGNAGLEKRKRLAFYFSDRMNTDLAQDYMNKLQILGMSPEELGAEIVQRIGLSEGFWYKAWYGEHHRGCCSPKSAKKLLNIVMQEIEDLEKKLEKADRAAEENKKIIMLIPPDYRYPLALETMLGFVKNLRASTWKECADLYEEQLHRWQMETNSAENLRLQREIRGLTKRAADGATAAAIFSGLNLLLK